LPLASGKVETSFPKRNTGHSGASKRNSKKEVKVMTYEEAFSLRKGDVVLVSFSRIPHEKALVVENHIRKKKGSGFFGFVELRLLERKRIELLPPAALKKEGEKNENTMSLR
jgi:hypothetical protein